MGAFFDAVTADVRLPATIVEDVDTSTKQVISNVDRELGDFTALLQDTERGLIKAVDNIRGDGLYTVRDVKDQVLITIDSAVDNFALVIDRQLTNVFDSIQLGILLSLGTATIFLILYGDELFKKDL